MSLITITSPDDWHLHLRDGAYLKSVISDTAKQFDRAVIMPNLRPPITTIDEAEAYRRRIMQSLREQENFTPLMTLYLTDSTSIEEIRQVSESEHVVAFKLYPAGATTNSDAGIHNLAALDPLLEAMQTYDVPLLLHGEVTDPSVDVFDREAVFIDRYLEPISHRFPGLRIVLEHITTREGAHFVRDSRQGIAATITAHHLLFNRNAMLVGGIHPHYYCLPILKREEHRLALLDAATSGNPKFFLGTDSAPHAKSQKEASCGCAGCYTARHALSLYAAAFDSVDKIGQLEAFASFHGADFYRQPRNTTTITLERRTIRIEQTLEYGEDELVPFLAGKTIDWALQS